MLKSIQKREVQLLISIILQVFIYSLLSNGKFFTVFNFQSMLAQLPEAVLFSLGMMLVILTGGINLALVTTGTMATIVGLYIAQNGFLIFNNYLLSFLVYSLIIGYLVGIFHGILVSKYKVSPIVLTLASSFLFTGIGLNITKGGAISHLPESYYIFAHEIFLGIPYSAWFLLVVFFALYIYLNKTVQGYQIYMIGSSSKATFYSGLSVQKIIYIIYILSALLGVLGGLVMTSRYNSIKIDYGFTYVLQSVAVVVMAGFDINGGKGKILNILLASINLQILSSGFNILGINRFIYIFAVGLLLLIITLIDQYIQQQYQKKLI
ncbi:MAG: ABC transporter permease [Brevinema sp.]